MCSSSSNVSNSQPRVLSNVYDGYTTASNEKEAKTLLEVTPLILH